MHVYLYKINPCVFQKGKSLEKVLTLEPNEFEKYLKDNQDINVEEERNRPESYAYGHVSEFRDDMNGTHHLYFDFVIGG